MTPARRMTGLLLLLAIAGGAVLWDRLRAPAPAAAVSAAVERPRDAARPQPASTAAATAEAPAPAVAALRPREGWTAAAADAFGPTSRPAPPAPRALPAAPAEPPRAVAPALPFTVLGRKFENGAWEVYLGSGEQLYIAKAGTKLGDNYRVEAIGASEIRLTYLPLNERQTLPTGTKFDD